MHTEFDLPSVDITTTRYYPDKSFCTVPTDLSEVERLAMKQCFELADGRPQPDKNPPVAAVLIHNPTGQQWMEYTDDPTTHNLFGHAEIKAYVAARSFLGLDLSKCTLVTTSQLCNTCTSPYAEGKIGKIVCAAPRAAVFEVAGIMRPRDINMHDLLRDGATNTEATIGLFATEALARFADFGALRKKGQLANTAADLSSI